MENEQIWARCLQQIRARPQQGDSQVLATGMTLSFQALQVFCSQESKLHEINEDCKLWGIWWLCSILFFYKLMCSSILVRREFEVQSGKPNGGIKLTRRHLRTGRPSACQAPEQGVKEMTSQDYHLLENLSAKNRQDVSASKALQTEVMSSVIYLYTN